MAIDHPARTGKLLIVDSLPALGAAQMPDATPQQLQAMAAQMQAAMRTQDDVTYAASQRRAVTSMASAPADVERIIGWGALALFNSVYGGSSQLRIS